MSMTYTKNVKKFFTYGFIKYKNDTNIYHTKFKVENVPYYKNTNKVSFHEWNMN